MKNGYRRTSLKVKVWSGLQTFERCVYEREDGEHFFKYDGQNCVIYKTDRGIYKAPYFVRVEYIED